jgi:DNA-binding SARP family transcriptional activator
MGRMPPAVSLRAPDGFSFGSRREVMHLHATMGNRAEALRVFGQCRKLLRDELGASPSRQTEAVFLKILRAGEMG